MKIGRALNREGGLFQISAQKGGFLERGLNREGGLIELLRYTDKVSRFQHWIMFH